MNIYPNGSPWPSPAASESEDDYGENVYPYHGHDPGIWPSEVESPGGTIEPGLEGILPSEYEEPDGTLYDGGAPGRRERGAYYHGSDSESEVDFLDPRRTGYFDRFWHVEDGDYSTRGGPRVGTDGVLYDDDYNPYSYRSPSCHDEDSDEEYW